MVVGDRRARSPMGSWRLGAALAPVIVGLMTACSATTASTPASPSPPRVTSSASLSPPYTGVARVVDGGCGSTVVYQGSPPGWLVQAGGGPHGAPIGLPYFSSESDLIGGFIFSYPLVSGVQDKILWAVARPRNGSPLMVTGHPLAAASPTVTFSFPDNASPGEIYPSLVQVPTPGCWALTLTWGPNQAGVRLSFRAPA